MQVLLFVVIMAALFTAALLFIAKGAAAWSTVAEGDLVDLKVDEFPIQRRGFSYEHDYAMLDHSETILTFADGSERRILGRLADPGLRGPIRLRRNWLGTHRFESATP